MASQILGERYQVQQELGKKAGRRTLLCSDQATGELVVIKLLTFSSDFEWDDLKLFEREAETLKSLSHPAIPRYLDYFEVNSPDLKGFALAQSYIPAPSWEQHVKVGRIFTETEVKEIAKASLEILSYLHRQNPPVIHRDLKPSNILLGDRSGHSVGQVYLVDFGSVQTVAAQEGATLTVVGTYGYMPSEQFGGRTVPASDLYSLGATLIYLLTGVHPADLPQKDFRIQFEQKAKVSSAFSDWLRSMTEPNLEKRFDSAFQALQALNKNNNYLAINYPFSSRIEFRKNNQSLEIIIRAKGFIFSDFVYCLIFSAILLLIGIMFLSTFLVAIKLINLWPIIYLFIVLSFISSYFIETRFNLSHQQITLTRKLFGFIKFHLTPPSPREDIIKLVYFSEYVTQNQDENGSTSLVTVSAQLEIWAGIYKYRFPGTSIHLPEYEVQLIAKELSSWLDLPILYANKQAEKIKDGTE